MGYADLDFMPDMNSISYKVVVSNIYGPTASHIHAGAMGASIRALTVGSPAF